MHILVIGKFYTEAFAQHILETLTEMGHSVLKYQPGLQFSIPSSNSIVRNIAKTKNVLYEIYARSPIYEKRSLIKLIDSVRGENIDLILVCHDFLPPSHVSELKKKLKVPIALWYPDHIGAFGKAMFLNGDYDFLFFKDPYIVKILRDELSKHSFYLPECCNPRYHNNLSLTQEDYKKYKSDLCTAGNLHANRIAFFDQLTNFNVKIWGNAPAAWADISKISKFIMHSFVANEEKSKAFIGSKIVLNNLQPAEIWGTNVRTFEIAGAGAFQIVSYRPGLHQLYKVNEEIVSFNNMDDLREKIYYFLQHPEERENIAKLGYERTHKEHTYHLRLQLLIDTVFNNDHGYPLEENYCL